VLGYGAHSRIRIRVGGHRCVHSAFGRPPLRLGAHYLAQAAARADRADVRLQGLLGAWTLLVCWVAIPLAAFFEGDPLLPSRDSLPPLATWPIIAASCASLVATNLSLSIAIACSSAFFMSIASLLSIPMAFAVDYWLHDTVPSALEAAGALCVVMAFLVLSLCAAPQRERRAAASDDTWEPTRVGGLAASPFDRETAGSSGLAAAEVKLLAPDACAGSSPAGGAA